MFKLLGLAPLKALFSWAPAHFPGPAPTPPTPTPHQCISVPDTGAIGVLNGVMLVHLSLLPGLLLLYPGMPFFSFLPFLPIAAARGGTRTPRGAGSEADRRAARRTGNTRSRGRARGSVTSGALRACFRPAAETPGAPALGLWGQAGRPRAGGCVGGKLPARPWEAPPALPLGPRRASWPGLRVFTGCGQIT